MRLQEIRQKRGLTMDELSKRAGVSRVTILRYEHKQRVPTVTIAQKLAGALGCTLDELLGDSKEAEACRTT